MPTRFATDDSGLAYARRLRLLATVSIIGAMTWFLLGVLEREARHAEERSANMVLSQLRVALVIRGAEVMLSRGGDLESQEGTNPFKLVEHQWPNYQGACTARQPDRGNWCFRLMEQKQTVSRPKGWLIYSPRQPINIDRRPVEPNKPLAWQVTTEFADRNGNGLREQEERPTGLKLSPVSLTEEAAQTQDAQR
ncbi:hypothetical protein BKP64_12255 [Marinobacter salinus]|uniref:Uncharacterized protein n=1 Tax=Marinobacter salinus TaxID=1874317 RepID=A0A1D9GMR5_9GAMM|nr:hypothetical protein [Marinobacter salinus]AOY88879.1 hypothetical protein BKP64_12255 [Marinobacter salinus]